MGEKLEFLTAVLAEVSDLNQAGSLLAWDMETYMPAGGVAGRAHAMAAVRRRSHRIFTSDRVARLLDACEAEVAGQEFESDDASLVRVTRREHERQRKVPADLVAEIAKANATARPVWRRAREDGDFALFAPHLARNVELNSRLAEAIGYQRRPYDALLERTEPGMTTDQLEAIFARLKEAIVPLVKQVAARAERVDDAFLFGRFEEQRQLDFALRLAAGFGYDLGRGRQDISAHPFSIGINHGDVRITTRVSDRSLPMCIFGSMHESGHAMYTQGHAEHLQRTPLWGGASPGFHESQSRLFENLVGRSRAFWRHWFGDIQKAFPDQLRSVDAEGFYRAVNRVYPSLIRVEADEVTYNLHILMRFELENDLLEGRLRVDEVPAAWNAKMEEYLGVEPATQSDGALQDIHWSGVSFGGFPGYTLGNLIGAQLMERVRADIPDLDLQVEAGEFDILLGWLREHVHRHGRKFTPPELLVRITGRELDAGPWIAYIQRKFGELYGLAD